MIGIFLLLSCFGLDFFSCHGMILKGSEKLFHEIYHKYHNVCQSDNNFVPNRVGFNKTDVTRYLPWSLSSGSVHHFLDLPFSTPDKVYGVVSPNQSSPRFEYAHNNTQHNIPYCSTINEIMFMMSQADWDVTPTCKLRWLSGASICKIMSQFSYVYINGDSLMRHTIVGLLDLVSEDLQRGRHSHYDPKNKYFCDGKYAENRDCILYSRNGLIDHKLINFQPYGFCKDVDFFPTTMLFTSSPDIRIKIDKSITCEELKERPMFVGLQGAIRYENNATSVIKALEEVFKQIKEQYSECMDSVYVMYTGQYVCIATLENMYDIQHHNYTHNYNLKMMSWLSTNAPNVHFLNPWNLSRMSLDRNSDGFHYLTDLNVIAALAMVNILNLIDGPQKEPAKVKELLQSSYLIDYD